jgi:hypothetical protein
MKSRRKSLIRHLLVYTSLTSCSLYAGPIPIEEAQFQESYNDSVNISGSVRAGVMYMAGAEKVLPDSLFLDLLPESDKLLCVSMISVDGRYGAEFSHKLSSDLTGLTQFQLPTEMHDVLTRYKPDQVAVLAEIKPACNDKGERIVPAAWGRPPADSSVIKVFLNSGAEKTYLKMYKKENGSDKLKCKSVRSETKTAYDTECTINEPQKYLLENTKVLRRNFGDYGKSVKLKISISQ